MENKLHNKLHHELHPTEPLARIVGKVKSVSLSQEEMDAGRDQLRVFMNTEKATQAVRTHRFAHIRSPFLVLMQHRVTSMVIALAVIVVGTSTSFAAQGALPGDLLYPIKIHVNEGIASAFTFGAEPKATLAMQYASTRLEEAEQLATLGKLNAGIQAELETSFNEHAHEVATYISDLSGAGAVDMVAAVSSDFEGVLEAHDDVIARISKKDTATPTSLSVLSDTVKKKLRDTTLVREQSEQTIVTTHDAEAVKSHARAAAVAAKTRISEVEKDARKYKGGRAELDTARQYEHEAQTALEGNAVATAPTIAVPTMMMKTTAMSASEPVATTTDSYGEAYLLFKKAQRKANGAQIIIRSGIDSETEDSKEHGRKKDK